MFDLRKYVALSRAAKYLDLSLDDLCKFILEVKVPLYADSEYVRPIDSDKPHMFQVRLSSIVEVLAADKTAYAIEFLYPRSIKKYRLSNSSVDDQCITRRDLYLLREQLDTVAEMREHAVGFEWSKAKNPRIKPKSTRIKSAFGSGSHWNAIRERLLSAANVELKANFEKYQKPNSKVNFSKLAEFLDENRNKWGGPSSDKNARSLTPKRIAERLGEFARDGRLYSSKVSR